MAMNGWLKPASNFHLFRWLKPTAMKQSFAWMHSSLLCVMILAKAIFSFPFNLLASANGN